jgi:hypothetical protein
MLGFKVKEWFNVALLMTAILAGSNNVFKVVENLKSRHNKGWVQLLGGMCLNMQLSLNIFCSMINGNSNSSSRASSSSSSSNSISQRCV